MEESNGERADDTSPQQEGTASKASSNSAANHLKQKRARSQLSCTPCRQGKLKCNRQHDPACDQCIKRNRENACVFLPPPAKNKPAQNVKGRIRQLESLVVDLMNQNRGDQTNKDTNRRRSSADGQRGAKLRRNIGPYDSQPTPPSDNDTSPTTASSGPQTGDGIFDDVDNATTPLGQMKISKDEISYVGESHWGAILDSISDLKRDLNDDEEEEQETGDSASPEQTINSWGSVPLGGVQPHASSGLGFMVGQGENLSRDELIAGVPEKKVADRLLSLWFNSPDPFKPLIHAPTFQDEYRRFWRSPRETPTMWLGLLFSIMSLAASFGLRDANPQSAQAQQVLKDVNKYHKFASSAALLADFTKPKQYTIECLILYAAGLRSNNAFVNVWLMIGLLIRLALRMGYHRDPSHYAGISVFHAEMRRRVWALISMIDVLISFQLGLPSMVKTIQSDTQPPRNLLDRDLNVTTKVLPPSRGVDELTPSSYTRAKLRITRIFADASELSHATVEPSREEILRLDRQLEDARDAIPPLLRMPEIDDVVTDPAEQLMCRFNLDLLYLKTKTVLHRRYMLTPYAQLTAEEQRKGVGYSRMACVDSARRVLQHHHTIYTASQTGGQLESVKWYMGSISTHDFLLAAMIICLELSNQMNSMALYSCPARPALMDALEKSQKIWSDASGRKRKPVQFVGRDTHDKGEHMFDETEKASRAMAVMIAKVRKRLDETPAGEIMECWSGGSLDAPIAIDDLTPESGTSTKQQAALSAVQQGAGNPFHGVVSNHRWDDIPDISQSYSMDSGLYQNNVPADPTNTMSGSQEAAMFDYSLPNGSTSLSNGVSPPGQQQQQQQQQQNAFGGPDFSMIGDMLDTSTLDWEMWDTTINSKGLAPPDNTWADIDSNALQAGEGMSSGNMIIGGSGPVPSASLASFNRGWNVGVDGGAHSNSNTNGPAKFADPMGFMSVAGQDGGWNLAQMDFADVDVGWDGQNTGQGVGGV